MEVKRNKPEPVEVPPDTIDITGLSLREAGALYYLGCNGLSWYRQEEGIKDLFVGLADEFRRARVEMTALDLEDM